MEVVRTAMATYDTDKSGTLSFVEFLRMLIQKPYRVPLSLAPSPLLVAKPLMSR